jgi:1-acyl-sn-glycerol-3-phosphate acyltransferase
MINNFDDIRPYSDDEISAAMKRIAESEYLLALSKFVFPAKTMNEIQTMLLSFKNIHDFQLGVMYAFNKQVIAQTIKNFTYSGFEYLDPAKNYLFVSNHRDIVLDSSLLQNCLHDEGFRTTEITFGNNLMSSPLVIDIGKSNKMFTVARGGTAREFYKNSLRLSEYIRYAINTKGESIWIAQRNGRTKDGYDATDQGIIKMFCMSNMQNLVQSVEELNIVPIVVSYYWEPCDMFKTKELYLSRDGEKYVKQKDEDLISILTGITQQKGKVHFNICKPLDKEEYIVFANEIPNKFFSKVAGLIDERIHENYKLWSSNYIAYDIRSGKNNYTNYYTTEEKEQFMKKRQHILSQIEGDKNMISNIFLGIYANPVDNKFKNEIFN